MTRSFRYESRERAVKLKWARAREGAGLRRLPGESSAGGDGAPRQSARLGGAGKSVGHRAGGFRRFLRVPRKLTTEELKAGSGPGQYDSCRRCRKRRASSDEPSSASLPEVEMCRFRLSARRIPVCQPSSEYDPCQLGSFRPIFSNERDYLPRHPQFENRNASRKMPGRHRRAPRQLAPGARNSSTSASVRQKRSR